MVHSRALSGGDGAAGLSQSAGRVPSEWTAASVLEVGRGKILVQPQPHPQLPALAPRWVTVGDGQRAIARRAAVDTPHDGGGRGGARRARGADRRRNLVRARLPRRRRVGER